MNPETTVTIVEQPQSGFEWNEIETLNVNAKTIAEAHKKRRSQGFYDIYNAKIVSECLKNFDDIDLMKVAPQSKKLETIMGLKDDRKSSLLDPDTDVTLLKAPGDAAGMNWNEIAEVKSDDQAPQRDSLTTDLPKDRTSQYNFLPPSEGKEEKENDEASSVHSDDNVLYWTYEGQNCQYMTANQSEAGSEVPEVPSSEQFSNPCKPDFESAFYNIYFDMKNTPPEIRPYIWRTKILGKFIAPENKKPLVDAADAEPEAKNENEEEDAEEEEDFAEE